MSVVVPFFDRVVGSDSVEIPYAYLVPPEWTFVAEKLEAHDIRCERLSHATALKVESYRFADIHFREGPYEGRQPATYRLTSYLETRTFPPGTLVVRTAQRTGKVLMHLLEPRGPDSFVAWGFFNAIFEQKEYAEAYVMENIGEELLRNDAAVQEAFKSRLQTDSLFARNPKARLNWLYQRSPWGDPWLNVYPVGRMLVPQALETVPARRYVGAQRERTSE
jgi:hypothetical protein